MPLAGAVMMMIEGISLAAAFRQVKRERPQAANGRVTVTRLVESRWATGGYNEREHG